MNQIRLYEVLKPKLGDEESKLLIEYIEGIRREIVTKDILEKTIELAKAEILAELYAKIEELRAKTEKDKTEILAKTEKDKAEISAKIEELRAKTEKDKTEILAKAERDKTEISAKIEELRARTEKDKTEILAKTEKDKTEILAKTEKDKTEIIKWVIGIILAQTTLLAALIIYLARH